MAERHVVRLTVNGESVERLVEPRKTLADFLRQDVELTGTHLGCEHGVCGACTVLLDGEPVRSCLLFAVQADGARVGTVEGLAHDGLHPIQEAFQDHFALQCGYCTPGMLMTVHDLLQRSPSPTREEIRKALAGNICRCTGYHAIVDAVEAAAARLRAAPPARGRTLMATSGTRPRAVGRPVKRVEDGRLLAGQGRFVDDLHLPRMVHAAFVRSPHAHARVRHVSVSRALALPGVVAVLTADEAARLCHPWRGILTDYVGMKTALQYPLALDKVRYVGEPVVAVADVLDLVEGERVLQRGLHQIGRAHV